MHALAVAADMRNAQAMQQRLHTCLRDWRPDGGWPRGSRTVAQYLEGLARQEHEALRCGLLLVALHAPANDPGVGPAAA